MKISKILILLLLIDCAIVLAHVFWKDWLGFFDLDKEGNLKGLFSGFQLLGIALSSGALAYLTSRLKMSRAQRFTWILLAAGFAYLALDDMMMIHERVGFVLNRWLGVNDRPFESFNWLVYYAPFIIAGTALIASAIRSLARIDRRIFWMACAGFAGLLVSLGLEVVGRQLLISGAIPLYRLEMIAEEASLLFGETFFFTAVLSAVTNLFRQAFIPRAADG